MQLKKFIHESERAQVLKQVAALSSHHSKALKIIDVGCGYGTYLAPLHSLGHRVTGIEVNPVMVASNVQKGLKCLSPADFKASGDKNFDLILMSHIIEHFAPDALIKFLDEHLDLLSPTGYLLIATPLASDYFYDDFDHVKPYHPLGIKMVFSSSDAQVQYYSRNKLILKDLWYRKSFYRIHHARGRHIRSLCTFALKALDYISIIFYLVTFRKLGKTDGWVGLFQKHVPGK